MDNLSKNLHLIMVFITFSHEQVYIQGRGGSTSLWSEYEAVKIGLYNLAHILSSLST